jgi:hypothetical protein
MGYVIKAADVKALSGLIDLLVKRAPELVAAGINQLDFAGLSVHIAARPPQALETAPAPLPSTQHSDPLSDPATFPGGRIPGFTREVLS